MVFHFISKPKGRTLRSTSDIVLAFFKSTAFCLPILFSSAHLSAQTNNAPFKVLALFSASLV